MNEIHITISDIPEVRHEDFVRYLRHFIEDYDPNLKLSVSEPCLWLSTRSGYFRLRYLECRFIETDNRKLLFHCEDSVHHKNGKISDILDLLPQDIFFRCNNSYIVNLHYIDDILPEGGRYNILLRSGEIIPLSRSCYQECLSRLQIHRVPDLQQEPQP